MQNLKRCIQGLVSLGGSSANRQLNVVVSKNIIPAASMHTSRTSLLMENDEKESSKFLDYNKKVFPVQAANEERRPAFVCHAIKNAKYSWKKMWYIACLVRGMTVDEAVKQLSFLSKKGGAIAKQAILEAQKMAVEDHNVEFKSNLWVAESFCTKGLVFKGVRRHARARTGEVRYGYIHYYVRLEEGKPPKHYYLPEPKEKDQLIEEWLQKKRMRRLVNSL